MKSKRKILFVLPGLHRINRGAEVAFRSVARCMAQQDGFDVTVMGSGDVDNGERYRFVHVGSMDRKRFRHFPKFPVMRSENIYEELSFVPGLLSRYQPGEYDATITCSYPFCNWVLSRRRSNGRRPVHLFVTQNGDWPAQAGNSEYKYFKCDGLVCTNPIFKERNREKYLTSLIPNGVDIQCFTIGQADRRAYGIPEDKKVVLICAALIPSKRVVEGIEVLAKMEDVHVVVAGDGPGRDQVELAGRELLGERFQRMSVAGEKMPGLYRCADVLLHMSMDEPFGNIYVEASAVGLPVVAHETASTRWILEDQGFLVDSRDGRAVISAIELAMSRCGGEHAQSRRDLVERRFAWDIIAGQYGEFIEQVIGQGIVKNG